MFYFNILIKDRLNLLYLSLISIIYIVKDKYMAIEISGRELELGIFNKVLQSGKFEFLAVTGRRRVGKTFLIKHGFSKYMTFYFTRIKDAGIEEQLAAFSRTLAAYYSMPFMPATP